MTKLKDDEVICGSCLCPGRPRASDPALIDHDGRAFPCRDVGRFVSALRHAIELDGKDGALAPYLGIDYGFTAMVRATRLAIPPPPPGTASS